MSSPANATIDSRMAEDPVDLGLLLATAGNDPEALEYRRVTATGTYNTEDEILLQARTLSGVSGHNAVTPLAMLDGALAVNRGWVTCVRTVLKSRRKTWPTWRRSRPGSK